MRLGLGNSLVLPRCGGAVSGVPVPSAYAQVLYHFDTDFTDSSANARNATLNAPNPTIEAGQSVFGGASALISTSGSIEVPGGSHLHFTDSEPMQISWRMRPTAAHPGEVWLMSSAAGNDAPGFSVKFFSNLSQIQLRLSGSDPFWIFTALPVNEWSALRINHDGAGTYRLYINGTRIGTTQSGSGATSNNLMRIGEPFDQGGAPYTGYVDEFLVEKHANLVITTGPTYEVETEPFVIV